MMLKLQGESNTTIMKQRQMDIHDIFAIYSQSN